VNPTEVEGDHKAIPREGITFRPAEESDYEFQRLLYHDVRREEMTQFPFTEEQKIAFLDWQFSCQYAHYREHYPTCEWNILEKDGQPIGRLLIDRWRDQIRIVDIALHSAWCGNGIGSMLLAEILQQGREAGLPVTIHVEVFNPAMRLYERLGFEHVDTSGAYNLMRWTPQVKTAS
jgi:GNAT superfamily N-acetyltransferase